MGVKKKIEKKKSKYTENLPETPYYLKVSHCFHNSDFWNDVG